MTKHITLKIEKCIDILDAEGSQEAVKTCDKVVEILESILRDDIPRPKEALNKTEQITKLKAKVKQLEDESHTFAHSLLNTLDYYNGHKVNTTGDELFDDAWVGVMEDVGSSLVVLNLAENTDNNRYKITKKGLDIMWSPTIEDLNRCPLAKTTHPCKTCKHYDRTTETPQGFATCKFLNEVVSIELATVCGDDDGCKEYVLYLAS